MRRRAERGFTLIELLVVITIIAILAAVVSASVGGFITSANERSRSAQFAAVQSAVDTFASTHLDASGDLSLATYPYSSTSTTGASTSCCVSFNFKAHNDDGSVTTVQGLQGSRERWTGFWYGADGRSCQTTGASCSAQPGSGSDEFYVYVDLYSGSDTDLSALGYVRLSPASSPGTVTTRTAGVPGTSSSTAFRCLFQSSASDAVSYSSTIAAAKSAVRTNKGKLYSCRDADPTGT